MTRFIVRHPLLFLLLTTLPLFALALLGVLYDVIDQLGAILLLVLYFGFLSRAVRHAPARVLREATYKLNHECDPDGFLSDVALLRNAGKSDARTRFVADMNYAVGLDAAGRSEDAYALLRDFGAGSDALSPLDRASYTINFAVVCQHTDRADDARELLSSVRPLLAGLHPLTTGSYEELIRSAEDAWNVYFGDTTGLREKMAARIARCREDPALRRNMLVNCMLLGRLYEKAGLTREAVGMYRYVARNGNRLGIVHDAEDRLAALTETATA